MRKETTKAKEEFKKSWSLFRQNKNLHEELYKSVRLNGPLIFVNYPALLPATQQGRIKGYKN